MSFSATPPDIEIARDFYASQAPEVGEYFVDSLLADIVSLEGSSGFIRCTSDSTACWPAASRLAFIIGSSENETQVFAILDLRRNPSWLRKELTGR